METKDLAKTVAKALFYSSIQSSLGSVEMSSKFSVLNFSKDQKTLQNAANALKNYIYIGSIWTAGTVLSLYTTNGWCGAWIGLIANLVMMGWIVLSYIKAFNEAAKENNLEKPEVFNPLQWKIILAVIFVTLGGLLCAQMKS